MDERDIRAHRRRSSSSALVSGGQQAKNRQSSQYHDELDDRIPEESDPGPSSSDFSMDDLRSEDGLEDDEEVGLSHTERKRRRRRKRHNTGLGERVAGDSEARLAEDNLVKATLLQDSLFNGVLIALWYTFSISISVYNKWMFSKENLDFHFPLFTTSLHMIVQFVLATTVLYFLPQFRPKRPIADGSSNSNGSYSRLNGPLDPANPAKPSAPQRQPLMTRWFYLSRIGPCGTATALDIGLGNFSLRFISLTFYTMCKSSVLAFVLVFAFLFKLEKPTWRLCAIILVMTAGVVMMVAGETAFNTLGFVLVMIASFCSGFRWSLTQILLLRNPATSNPFSSIFFVSPVMFVALFVLAVPIEGPLKVIEGCRVLGAAKGWFLGTVIMLFPGFLAFLMVAAEFTLLKRTSVVTLSVCGIFKEVLTISAAATVFGDELSPINISGLIVTIASIAGYNYLKYTTMTKEARKEAHQAIQDEAESVPLRSSGEQQHSGVGTRKSTEASNGHNDGSPLTRPGDFR
ncbi:hypothetical protein LTR91_001155 [Friedmanniomyces endolithicus]|uniref:Sugar phosphate transporter domain-containing protein n=1 Tax=Friedmanniomyces endolithicus TaxID=329885 RepID=A0AAN6FHR7_9PEZI|nr:hypothetical protein LTR35_015557 [Friedmanniomyces endolithicus]KAK0299927.1 hypothetical protein LTS00_001697 [Friedmanniomyces endolithicus]KAK0318013.1 hypothetical protein LTR82_011003 [Friedmanniomyces endolithicus]KAK0922991.1 hypothetical protein LTR57_007288 [Friedmanniomyces endolithicus]KAK1011350.1 hypothetical protein LTS01_001206 [Friedmanniomyces endolithicus]